MKEQPLFAPGDRVVCVDSKTTSKDSSSRELIQDKQYTVSSLLRCSCGWIYIDVGIRGNYNNAKCRCGQVHVLNGIAMHRQIRFVPVDFDRYADNELHQALKGIPETL